MPSQKKVQIVSSLVEKLSHNPNFVVVDFDSASHTTLESLRRSLFEKAATMEVVKNSLFKVVLQKLKKDDMAREDVLKGNSAVIQLPDEWIEILSRFYKFAKTSEGLVFKIGLLDGQVYDRSGLEKMALLPSREELIVKLISSLKSPQTRVVYSLNFGMMKFINVLKQKSAQGGEQ